MTLDEDMFTPAQKLNTGPTLMRVVAIVGKIYNPVPDEDREYVNDDGVVVYPPEKRVYLASFDVDAHGGIGEFTLTENRDEALRFGGVLGLYLAWRSRSQVKPWRDDGEPNRPLTAMTITPEPA